ncbi:MAG: PP2C family protein-serine/threonine phosphatase [Candidatus Limnocylindrales bacterium]
MTPRRHLERLDLDAVVGPFEIAGADGRLVIEDEAGRGLAGGAPAGASEPQASAPIRVHDELAGRVVLIGAAADTSLGHATVQAIAAALAIAASGDPTVTRVLDEELAHGRRLQRSFVSLVPPDVPGYDLASRYEAAREVGGDFFDLFRLRRRGRPLSIVIADVTGKGIAAALLMAFARPLIHSAIDHATGPSQALERVNHILIGERRTSLFITALAAELDIRTGMLRLANAGHEPPLFIPGDGSPPDLILGSGPLVGAFPTLDLPEVEAFMAPGDVVLLYTDGVTDARSPAGDRFDETGLLAAIERARGGSAHDIVREVRDSVEAFAHGAEPADDITIVGIGRRRDGA